MQKILKIGSKDSKGNILILGGHGADLFQSSTGEYFTRFNTESLEEIVCSSEEEAIKAYNTFNGTSLSLDYISKYFRPWYQKTHPKLEEQYFEVPSSRDPTLKYKVQVHSNGDITCDPRCPGFYFRHSCGHVNSVREFLKEQGI